MQLVMPDWTLVLSLIPVTAFFLHFWAWEGRAFPWYFSGIQSLRG